MPHKPPKYRHVKRLLATLVIGSLFTHGSLASNQGTQTFQWPKKYKAAVSLAYDDATPSQLDTAIPQLNKYRLHGSFYLPLGAETLKTRLPEWRAAAKKGHELGNHSLFHQCVKSLPGREWVKPEDDLDTISAIQMQQQVLLGNTMLHTIDGKSQRTYTVPCTDLKAKGENYIELIKNHFVAIKATVGSGVIGDMDSLDLNYVPVATPVNMTGDQLIAIVEEAGRKGTMANFTFHGVGGDHLSISTEAHEQLLAFLAKHRHEYWTDTFINITGYVRSTKKSDR